MSCNAFNHHPDCSCGFGGENYGSGTGLPRAMYPWNLHLHTDWSCQSSYTIPNVQCWECGQAVFFHRSPNGGSVLFDALGPPWPIHPCFERRVRQPTVSGPINRSGVANNPHGGERVCPSSSGRGGTHSRFPAPHKPFLTDPHWYALCWLDMYPHPNDRRITIVKAMLDSREITLFCDDPGRQLLTRGPMFYRPGAGLDGYDISALIDAQAQTLQPKQFVGFYDCGRLMQWQSAHNPKPQRRAVTQTPKVRPAVDPKKKPESSFGNIESLGDWQAFQIKKVTLDPQNITKITLEGLVDRFDIFISGTSFVFGPNTTVYLRPRRVMVETSPIECYELTVSNELSHDADSSEWTRLAYICEQDLQVSHKKQQRTPKKSHADIARGAPSSLHKVQATLSVNKAKSRVRRNKPRSSGYGTRLSLDGASTRKTHAYSTRPRIKPT